MRATRLICIAKDFGPFRMNPHSGPDPLPYREVTHQPDDMPEFFVGKPMATVDEVKASIAKRPSGEDEDFFWDEPDDEERAAVPGAVCVMRNVRVHLAAAAGGPLTLRVRMVTRNADGLFAWIETRDDIDTVVVAGNGRIYFSRLLGGVNSLDWGYEGCHALFLRWYVDRLIVVSFERSNYIRWIEPMTGKEDGFWLSAWSHSWLIDGDLLIWFNNNQRGLVQTMALPSLRPGLPIPFSQPKHAASYLIQLKMLPECRLGVFYSGGGGLFLETLGLPSASQRAEIVEEAGERFLDAVDANLFPDRRAPWPARLLLEAFSYAFLWESLAERVWRPSPVWLPIYWHRYLLSSGRAGEAAELLTWLDRIAAPLHAEALSVGWRPEWDLGMARVSLAVIHVRRTCRLVAEALREGKLPEGTYCLLFDPFPGTEVKGSRVDSSRFPSALRQAFEELRLSESSSLRL